MDVLLARLQERGWGWPFGLLTTTLSFSIWWCVYQQLSSIPGLGQHPVILLTHPAILVTSIMVHECGHYLGYRRMGLRPIIFAMIIGGAAYVPTRHWQERLRTATLGEEVGAHLGGVIANLVLLLAGWAMTAYAPWRLVGQATCYLNGLIIVTNLLPISALDGGRFWQRMFGHGHAHDFSRLSDRAWLGVYAGLILIGALAIQRWHFI